MKKNFELKKDKNIIEILFFISSIIILIITFIGVWCEEQIFEEIFVFAFFLELFIILLHIVFLIFSLVLQKINKSKLISLSSIILLFSLVLKLIFII